MKKNKAIGIIGGMGHYASAYFYKLLLDKSKNNFGAKNNEDFPEIVLNSIPVPDLKVVEETLSDSVRKLDGFGVGALCIVCNTAHIFYEKLAKVSQAELVSIIQTVREEVRLGKMKRIGILATSTTIKSGLYQRELRDSGIKIFTPARGVQQAVEAVIKKVIMGRSSLQDSELLSKTVRSFIAKNDLDGLILGCTELPLIFSKSKFKDVKIFDSLDLLADELLNRYYKS